MGSRWREPRHRSDSRPQGLFQECTGGGTVSLSGVYGGFLNMVPLGAAFQKGVTIRMGQCNVLNYIHTLMKTIKEGEIDPSFVITHRRSLADGPDMYETFNIRRMGASKWPCIPSS
jgi:threonine dehydrogenase-like Zn-dependent dehydrogenase